MALPEYIKDPSAKLDYGFDWSEWLGTDTIVSSTWAVDAAGPTLSNPTFSATKTTIWVAGGTVGSKYRLTNHIITASSPAREDERSFNLKIKEQ